MSCCAFFVLLFFINNIHITHKKNSGLNTGFQNLFMQKYIEVKGAKVNNLKNINVRLPQEKFIVITGVSGSGKSSLAFDTL